ncbi:sulfatase family protein [Aurantiacibacter sp. MUD61]|uniref:sulfatase family protein n=1 Tax=Aurantiacibacter sp. MUD61 TaxID=3009083 RepID=UPI0022F0D83D|nr:sulfatase [Aurantiacibacter sp. MUD61]
MILFALVALQSCAPAPVSHLTPNAGAGPIQPNIILITAEDLSPRFGFMGDDVAVTPNVDALAQESVVFTRAFTTAGVCAPARSALITGAYQTSIGTQHMRTSMYDRVEGGIAYEAVPPAEVKAFPELLRAAGYYTVNDQKTDYQFGNPFTVWDQSRDRADWNARATGQPFFAMINHEVTHEGRTWPPDTDPDIHPNVANRARLNAQIDAQKDFPLTDPATVRIPDYWPDTPVVRQNLARFYDNIRLMDEQVGALLDQLEAEGRFQDSIIIFTTDHGDGLPRHKRTIFDSGTRVPLIVRFPDGYGAGTRRHDLVNFVDLAPTILSLAGVSVPEWMDGRNIFADPSPDAIFMAGDRFDEVPQRFRGIREERFHYIRYFGDAPVIPSLEYQNINPIMREMRRLHAAGGLTPLQASYLDAPAPRAYLFDTLTDPDEVNNLAGNPRYAEVEARLAAELGQWIEVSGDMGRIPERQMVEAMWPGGEQPETAAVTACRNSDGRIELSSPTPGASIGWGGESGESMLYSSPLTVQDTFVSRAIRYGYAPSEPVIIRPETLADC